MKEQVSQELQSEFKKGNLKPSQLKRSKSESDLPKSLPAPETLRRNSIEPLTNPKSLKKQLEEAQDEISTLGLQVEIQGRELGEFKEENEHLKEQGKIKQQELEKLRETLEEITTELTQVKQDLDASLAARLQGLKDWNQIHQKVQTLNSELNNTVEESAEELTKNEETITSLKSQLFKAQQQVNSLTRDLDLSTRLIELRNNVPYFEPEFNSLNYLQYGIYSLMAVGFMLTLMRKREGWT